MNRNSVNYPPVYVNPNTVQQTPELLYSYHQPHTYQPKTHTPYINYPQPRMGAQNSWASTSSQSPGAINNYVAKAPISDLSSTRLPSRSSSTRSTPDILQNKDDPGSANRYTHLNLSDTPGSLELGKDRCNSQETPPLTDTQVAATKVDRLDSTATTQSKGVKRQLDVGLSPSIKRRCSTAPSSDESPRRSSRSSPEVFHSPGLDKMNQISDRIMKYYQDAKQTDQTFKQKIRLREALYSVLKGVFPYCGLYLVGSSMNGFGSNASDMDMCLMLTQQVVDQKNEAPQVLRIIFKSLKKCKFIRQPPVLIRAKVPILRFRDTISGVECDLNVNNGVGIRNTHLLNAYSQADWRIKPLALFVKHWAKSQNINDASRSSISSYSFTLMVIHYLQCAVKPVVLPNLQQTLPHKFDQSLDVRQLQLETDLPPFNTLNTQSLAELFLGFLQYYSKFDFHQDGISVRKGEKIPVDILMRQTVNTREWKHLCIEEPFNMTNTARSVFDSVVWERIHRVFTKSYNILSKKKNLDAILLEPIP